jgi:hypothetical protein
LNWPFESAFAVALDSGEATVIVALAFAPLPSTRRLPELSDAFDTLTAASAPDGASVAAPTSSRKRSPVTLLPAENPLFERFMCRPPMTFVLCELDPFRSLSPPLNTVSRRNGTVLGPMSHAASDVLAG